MAPSDRRAARARGGLIGLLVGDALGVPFEFRRASELRWLDSLTYTTPATWARSHGGTPPGTWSDDGAQALALASSLAVCRGLDEEHLAAQLVAWWRSGAYTPDGRVFDVGNRTAASLGQLERGRRPPPDAQGKGNGAMMRVLPLALLHRGGARELVELARRQARLTHPNAVAELGAAFVAFWAWEVLHGFAVAPASPPWEAFCRLVPRSLPDDLAIEELQAGEPNGSGYTPDTLATVIGALELITLDGDHPDYARELRGNGWAAFKRVVLAAIKAGNDTDTTAAIAGGLAGVLLGETGIPRHLVHGLLGEPVYRPALDAITAAQESMP